MTTPKKQPGQPKKRYNPNDEPGELGPVFASNWEILRRAPAFREVANKWVENETFRFEHAGEQKVYMENRVARCALDWMLTPDQRYALAKFQMEKNLFFDRPTLNYGPILVEKHPERQKADLANGMAHLFNVRPDPDPGGILELGQIWPNTPVKFQTQFSSILGGKVLEKFPFEDHGIGLSSLGNYLVGSDQLTAENQASLGRRLLQIGDELQRFYGDFHIFVIRRQSFYSERAIDEVFQQIKDSLPIIPRKGNDWDGKKSFLGTPNQWDKLLAWEAAGDNPYAAAADFLPKPPPGHTAPVQPGKRQTRSDQKKNRSTSLEDSVRAIEKWYPLIYPIRNFRPG